MNVVAKQREREGGGRRSITAHSANETEKTLCSPRGMVFTGFIRGWGDASSNPIFDESSLSSFRIPPFPSVHAYT